MVRTRYIGSNRALQAGFSAAHMRDFTAHVTGGDWIHLASQVSVTGGYGNVQAELDAIIASISILPGVVVGPASAQDGSIAIFDGTSGKLLRDGLTQLDSFGDLIFPDGTGYNLITSQQTNSGSQGQALVIFAQNNLGGQGGELDLGSGVNSITGIHDGAVNLFTPFLTFDPTVIAPTITQKDSAAATNDLFIISQSSTNINTPSNLWLESGTNSLGQAGDVKLYTYPGVVDVLSNGLFFNKDYLATIKHTENDVPVATDMYIIAQGIAPSAPLNPDGAPANLFLFSGSNPNNNTDGYINISSGFSNTNFFGGALLVTESTSPPIVTPEVYSVPGVYLYTSGGILYAQGSDMVPHALNQNNLRILESKSYFAAGILNTPFNGGSPTTITNSFLQPTVPLLTGDIVEFEYVAILFDNSIPVVGANLLVQCSENGGSAINIQNYSIPATTKEVLSIIGTHTVAANGSLNIYLAGTTAGVTNANVSSFEQNFFIGRWRVLRSAA